MVYSIYYREIEICPGDNQPKIHSNKEHYKELGQAFKTIEEVKNYLLGLGAIPKTDIKAKSTCQKSIEYIIVPFETRNFFQKVDPDYIKNI